MTNDKDVRPGTEVTTGHRATPEEVAAVLSMDERAKRRPPAPKLTVWRQNGGLAVAPDHPDPATGHFLLTNSLGATDTVFVDGLIGQLINAGTQGRECDGKGPNFMLSVIQGIAPRDGMEAMLAAQMAAVHMATMTFARRLAHVENIPQQDAAERAFNKLARTFAAQMEALKRYRTRGEQKVTIVHRVVVNKGGQAIVGTVSPAPGGGGGSEKREATP